MPRLRRSAGRAAFRGRPRIQRVFAMRTRYRKEHTMSMKTCRILATLFAGALAAPALADFGPRPPSVAVFEMPSYALVLPTDAIHAGGGSAEDTALAHDVATALAADARLDGSTITVAANRGNVMLSGSADSPEQADIAQQTARRVAGVGSVSGTLSSQGG
jgi:hypothetical protein